MLRGKSGSGLDPETVVRIRHSQGSLSKLGDGGTGPGFLLSSQQLLSAKELTLDSAT